jgi:hypothetical protein
MALVVSGEEQEKAMSDNSLFADSPIYTVELRAAVSADFPIRDSMGDEGLG